MQKLELLRALLVCSALLTTSAAQVTVSGNGSSNPNGLTALEGSAVSGVANNDTMWADSTDGRWKVNNHNTSPQDLAVWPCSGDVGGMVYGDALNLLKY